MIRRQLQSFSYRVLQSELVAGRDVMVRIASYSMAPALQPGDRLTVSPVEVCRLVPGVIILFQKGGDFVAHRIRRICNEAGVLRFVTRGDHSPFADRSLDREAILGYVRAVERKGQIFLPPAVPFSSGLEAWLLQATFPDADLPAPVWPWLRIVEAAEQEGLAPLLYGRLLVRGEAGLPPDLMERLRRNYYAVRLRNDGLLRELQGVLTALRDMPVLVLKGPVLALQVYADPAFRPFSDLDLLVHPQDFPQADRALKAAGFLPPPSFSAPDVTDSPYLNSAVYRRSPEAPAIHLHWHLFNSTCPVYAHAAVDVAALWAEARPLPGGGLQLCPEHELIHLSEHAVRHGFERLIWARDIAGLLDRYERQLDWNRVVALARDWGLRPMLQAALRYVGATQHVCVPEMIWHDGVGGLGQPSLPLRAFHRLAVTGRRRPYMEILVTLASAPTAWQKARILARCLVPPRAVLAQAYGLHADQIGMRFYVQRIQRGLGACWRSTRIGKQTEGG